jgi:hypothetical protein
MTRRAAGRPRMEAAAKSMPIGYDVESNEFYVHCNVLCKKYRHYWETVDVETTTIQTNDLPKISGGC